MAILNGLGEFLGSRGGSFVYHLLLLLAVEAALAMAWQEWRRTRDEQARRVLITMAGLAGARLLYVGAVLLASGHVLSAATLLPLERLADTASICLLGWGVLRPGRTEARIWGWFFSACLLGLFACGGTFLFLWRKALIESPALDYALFWQASVWSALQIALSVLVAVAALRTLRTAADGESRIALAALTGPAPFFFLGGLLQILLPGQPLAFPFWERLTNLAGYPLIAVAAYQGIVGNLRLQARQLHEISQASLDQIKSLLLLIEGARQVSGSLSLSQVLENAVHGVARALDADQCAVVLLEEAEPSYVRLASVFNAQAGKPVAPRGDAVTFPLDYQLTIQQAMRRKKSIMVDDPDNVQLHVLFNLLGSSEAGPLLVQPLLGDGEAIGAILVGNSLSRRSFGPNEAKLCQSMADQVSVALQNAQRYQGAQERIRELHRLLGDQRRGLGELPAKPVQEARDGVDLALARFSAWGEDADQPSADIARFSPARSGRVGDTGSAKPRSPSLRSRTGSGQGPTGA